jgi:hypothetical protein
VERENIMARQDSISMQAALEQERKKVRKMNFIKKFIVTHMVKKFHAVITTFRKIYSEPLLSSPPFYVLFM